MSLKHQTQQEAVTDQYKSTVSQPAESNQASMSAENKIEQLEQSMEAKQNQAVQQEQKLSPEVSVEWTSELEKLLVTRHRRVRETSMAHHTAADLYGAVGVWLGVFVVLINVVIGSAIFTSVGKTGEDNQKYLAGIITMLAGAFSALQTFFGFSPKSEKHRTAANRYSAIRRKMETTAALPAKHRGDAKQLMDEIAKEMDAVANESPEVSRFMWEQSQRKLKDDPYTPLFSEPR